MLSSFLYVPARDLKYDAIAHMICFSDGKYVLQTKQRSKNKKIPEEGEIGTENSRYFSTLLYTYLVHYSNQFDDCVLVKIIPLLYQPVCCLVSMRVSTAPILLDKFDD